MTWCKVLKVISVLAIIIASCFLIASFIAFTKFNNNEMRSVLKDIAYAFLLLSIALELLKEMIEKKKANK